MRNKITTTVLTAAASCMTLAQGAWAHPGMFSDMSFEAAKKEAQSSGKLLVVDFSAPWCPPCHMLDETTFKDPDVEKWIKENAIAIQVDIDKHKDVAKKLDVNMLPTIVMFKGNYDKEFDRDSTYKDKDELLTWLNAVKDGKTAIAVHEAAMKSLIAKGGSEEVQARYKMTRHLMSGKRYPEATEQLIWLWTNIPKNDPAMVGVRGSYMVAMIQDLLAAYPDAKPKFVALRDDAEKNDKRNDWVSLNNALGEQAKTLAWFDSIKDQPDLDKKLMHVDYQIEPLLLQDKRWADIGKYLYKDPTRHLEKQETLSKNIKEMYQKYAGRLPSEVTEFDPFPKSAGILYAGLLAAGNDAKAEEVAKESIKMDDSYSLREAFILDAYLAGKFNPSQLKWIDDNELKEKKDAGFYLDRGRTYLEVKQLELALKDYDRVAALSKDDKEKAEAAYFRAVAYDKPGKADLAAAEKKKVTELGGFEPSPEDKLPE